MVDYEVQRANMVESQVRPSDVTDRRVIRAMSTMPREVFLPETLKAIAYMDGELLVPAPAGERPRVVLSPRVVARMVQALDLPASGGLVMVIGCPTGYCAAIVSRLVQTVVALEPDAQVAKAEQAALATAGCDNVAVVEGAMAHGHAEEGPYDAIMIAGSVEEVPPALLDQLKDGGRLVAIEATARASGLGVVTRWQRSGTAYGRRGLFEAGLAPLEAFQRAPGFAF